MSRLNTGHVSIQLEPNEACVVLEKKFWDHMIKTYSIMASDCSDPVEKGNWVSIIQAVSGWIEKTHYAPKYDLDIFEDEDEWQ